MTVGTLLMAGQLRGLPVKWYNSDRVSGQTAFQHLRRTCPLPCCAKSTNDKDRASPPARPAPPAQCWLDANTMINASLLLLSCCCREPDVAGV